MICTEKLTGKLRGITKQIVTGMWHHRSIVPLALGQYSRNFGK